MHRYAQQRVGRSAADEIAFETFLVAFDNRQKFAVHKEAARPWLLGIATNLLRRHWRAERQQLAAHAKVLEAQGDGRRSEEPPAGPDARSSLSAALGTLSSEDRDALLMLVWADLSYQQIADALAVPIGTVRSRIARARRQMQQRIEPPATNPCRRTTSCLTFAEETNDG